jgi:gluconate 2-dehydrogenase gamma chain
MKRESGSGRGEGDQNRESGIGNRESRVTDAGPEGVAGLAPMADRGSIPGHALSRRQAIGLAAAAAALPALDWTDAQAQHAAQLVRRAAPRSEWQAPKFFTADEWELVRLLVDYVIPKDAKSGSATDAKVPEFMDYMMSDPEASPASRLAMRGGLAWLDTESGRRFGTGFVASADAQRRAILDDIAWPERARPEMSHGVAFFNRFRDLTASGFFSSAIGYADLDYRGNVFVAEWTGCPPEALRKLGLE